jgi:hypothetical protein
MNKKFKVKVKKQYFNVIGKCIRKLLWNIFFDRKGKIVLFLIFNKKKCLKNYYECSTNEVLYAILSLLFT